MKTAYAYAETWCSQCGQSLGPGNSGASRCSEHADPHPLDLGGCQHCSTSRGVPVADCPQCGEDRCQGCAAAPCTQPVACGCGRTVEGRVVRWIDDEPTCAACRVTCDACGEECGETKTSIECVAREVDNDWCETARVCGSCALGDE